MAQVLHGSASTTNAIRAAIQRSKASNQELSERYGINPKTMANWRKHGIRGRFANETEGGALHRAVSGGRLRSSSPSASTYVAAARRLFSMRSRRQFPIRPAPACTPFSNITTLADYRMSRPTIRRTLQDLSDLLVSTSISPRCAPRTGSSACSWRSTG